MRIGALTAIEYDRIPLAVAFIRHYKKWCNPLDIHVMVQRNHDGLDNREMFKAILQEGANPIDWTGRYSTEDIKTDHAKRTKELFGFKGWHFNVDSDEFFDRSVDVVNLCRRAQAHGKVFVRAQMVDMVSRDESFPELLEGDDPYGIFPQECNLTQGVVQGYPIKDCLLQNPYYGHHNAWGVNLTTQRFQGLWKLHHFKWDKYSYDRMKERIKEENRDRFPYWSNFKLFTDYVDKHGSVNWKKFPIDNSKFS